MITTARPCAPRPSRTSELPVLSVHATTAETAYQRLRAGERTGRPLADGGLIDRLEAVLGRRIHRQKPGPKPGSKRTAERREAPKR